MSWYNVMIDSPILRVYLQCWVARPWYTFAAGSCKCAPGGRTVNKCMWECGERYSGVEGGRKRAWCRKGVGSEGAELPGLGVAGSRASFWCYMEALDSTVTKRLPQ